MISTSEGVQASKTRANRKLSRRVSGESMVTERESFSLTQNIGLNPQHLCTYQCNTPLPLPTALFVLAYSDHNFSSQSIVRCKYHATIIIESDWHILWAA